MREERNTGSRTAQFVFALTIVALACLSVIGCSTIKYVPIENVEKIIYRDSTIYVNDTITVEVEKQTVKEVLPQLDTSILKTDIASSIAYLDTTKRQIHHELKQEGTIRIAYDTVYVTKTVEKIKEVEVPIEVEKEVKYTPDWIWYSLIFNIITILFIAFRIYLKLKK